MNKTYSVHKSHILATVIYNHNSDTVLFDFLIL